VVAEVGARTADPELVLSPEHPTEFERSTERSVRVRRRSNARAVREALENALAGHAPRLRAQTGLQVTCFFAWRRRSGQFQVKATILRHSFLLMLPQPNRETAAPLFSVLCAGK